MTANLRELLASLPEEERETATLLDSAEAQEQLKAIFADLAHRPVPVHSLSRLWTIDIKEMRLEERKPRVQS